MFRERALLLLALVLTPSAWGSAIENPLNPADLIQIKIQRLETGAMSVASLAVRAQIYLCVDVTPTPKCASLGNTGRIDLSEFEFKTYDGESSTTMPSLYSPVVTAAEIQTLLDALPPRLFGPLSLRVELRQNSAYGPDTVELAATRVLFPARSLTADNPSKELQIPLTLEPPAGSSVTSAQVDILIKRP